MLKPGRCLSLCWHDPSATTWRHVQDIMARVGFTVEESDHALFIDTGSNTYNQRVTDKVVKRDLVLNFRKPLPGESGRAPTAVRKDNTPFDIRARLIISDYLKAHPGSSKDRIYDHFMCKLIKTARMEDHDFEKLLVQVARKASDGRNAWFLK